MKENITAKQVKSDINPLNALDRDGNAPLHRAARDNDVDTLLKLIAEGADIEVKTETAERHKWPGMTPLIMAAYYGHSEAVVSALIAAGADMEATVMGWNALQMTGLNENGYTEEDGKWKVAKILIAAGADINAVNDQGNSMLSNLTRANKTDFMKIIIKAGQDRNSSENRVDRCIEIIKILQSNPQYQPILSSLIKDDFDKDINNEEELRDIINNIEPLNGDRVEGFLTYITEGLEKSIEDEIEDELAYNPLDAYHNYENIDLELTNNLGQTALAISLKARETSVDEGMIGECDGGICEDAEILIKAGADPFLLEREEFFKADIVENMFKEAIESNDYKTLSSLLKYNLYKELLSNSPEFKDFEALYENKLRLSTTEEIILPEICETYKKSKANSTDFDRSADEGAEITASSGQLKRKNSEEKEDSSPNAKRHAGNLKRSSSTDSWGERVRTPSPPADHDRGK